MMITSDSDVDSVTDMNRFSTGKDSNDSNQDVVLLVLLLIEANNNLVLCF